MLPSVLSERVCSLRGNVDRYAGKYKQIWLFLLLLNVTLVSVLWTLDQSYKVLDVWFGRTVIRSSCEMEYDQAQQLLDGEEVATNLGM